MTFADALGCIVDAHHGLSFAQHWGVAEYTSSDGQFHSANRGSGVIDVKYGPDPGLKIHSVLSGQYGSFHSSVIGATQAMNPLRSMVSREFQPALPPSSITQVPAACRITYLLCYWE